MTASDFWQVFDGVTGVAAAVVGWSLLRGYKAGRWLQQAEDRDQEIVDGQARIVKYISDVDDRVKRASQKQSDIEGTTTAKIGHLEMEFRAMRTEMTLRTEQTDKDHKRFEQDIELLKRWLK